MNLQRLRYFEAVGRLASFRRAAEELNITQPALSRQIQVLEQEVGTHLLLRSRRPVVLSPAGSHLWVRCHELLDETGMLLKEVQRIGTGESGPLTIGMLQSLLHGVFPHAFMRWRKEAGRTPLRVFGFSSPQIIAGVLSGQYDFGIVATPPDNPKLAIKPLFHDPFVVVLPTGHRLSQHRSVAVRDLSGEPHISWPRGYAIRDLIDRSCDPDHPLLYTAEVESLGSILELVRARLGIALLPQSAVTPTPRGLVLRALRNITIVRRICSIERHGTTLSASSKLLIGLITSAATPR